MKLDTLDKQGLNDRRVLANNEGAAYDHTVAL